MSEAMAMAYLLEARRRIALAVLRQLASAENDLPAATAREAGLTAEQFADDDLYLIADVLLLDCPFDLTARLKVCKTMLVRGHLWDRTEIAGNMLSYWWSDAKLAALARSETFCRGALEHGIADLRAVNERVALLDNRSVSEVKQRIRRQRGRAV